MSQTTRCCPEAYHTGNNRRQNKTYVIMAGSSAYKGWACPRLVTQFMYEYISMVKSTITTWTT